MMKLTEECEIAPYVWVHPDEERRGGAGTVVRKDGRSGPDAHERGGASPCREHQTSNLRTRLEGGFSSAIKFCFRKHFGFRLIPQHCCQHLGARPPFAPSPLLSLRDLSQQSPALQPCVVQRSIDRSGGSRSKCNADVNPLRHYRNDCSPECLSKTSTSARQGALRSIKARKLVEDFPRHHSLADWITKQLGE